MRKLITTLLVACSLSVPITASSTEQDVTARLLVTNPAPYLGEELDLLLEVTYDGHPGGRTRFSWPALDNFVAADLTTVRSQRGRDRENRLIETITRRIKPLTAGTLHLNGAVVLVGNRKLELPAISVRVRHLPATDRPEGFNDQIGTYRLMLAASGTGPREIKLHIYDSNQLAPVPGVQSWPQSVGQLIPIDSITRAAGGRGREHVLRYFYTPPTGENETLRFTLPVYDPTRQEYIELETGPAAKTTSALTSLLIASGVLLFAGGLTIYRRRRRPRTIAGCLEKICRRPVTGLSREKLKELLQPHLDQSELVALQVFWRNEDSLRFNRYHSTRESASFRSAKRLRKSLWKAIDKQQNIT